MGRTPKKNSPKQMAFPLQNSCCKLTAFSLTLLKVPNLRLWHRIELWNSQEWKQGCLTQVNILGQYLVLFWKLCDLLQSTLRHILHFVWQNAYDALHRCLIAEKHYCPISLIDLQALLSDMHLVTASRQLWWNSWLQLNLTPLKGPLLCVKSWN